MTTPPAPTGRPSDMPDEPGERPTLLAMLAYVRGTAIAKATGLADGGGAPIATSPLMSVGGVVHHLRWVETWWIGTVFSGEEETAPWSEADPDGEWRLGAQLDLAHVLADYAAESARLDAIVAAHALDDLAVGTTRRGQHPPLRWVLLHLVEETARHNGHLDLLRELADGVTGD